MPDNLCYTQKVRGFQQQKVEKAQNRLIYHQKRTKHRFPCCGLTHVAAEAISERQVRGEPMGACRHVFLRFTTHRLYCHKCHNRNMEYIPFLLHPKSRPCRHRIPPMVPIGRRNTNTGTQNNGKDDSQ